MDNIFITGSKGFIGTIIRETINPFYYEEGSYDCGRKGTLIHLLSYTKENESFNNPVDYIENNICKLAQLLTENSFDKVIFPSSYAIYNRNGNLDPKSVYGITKLSGEMLVKLYCKNYWILRLANPYGIGSKHSVLTSLLDCKKNNKIFTIYKDTAGIYKDFFPVEHIGDVVKRILEGKIKSGIYNVGSGYGTNVYDLLINICMKAKIQFKIIDAPKGLSDWYFTDHDNLLRSKKEDVETQWLKYLL
jgi:UDP-glucose 4-epimerase